MDFICNQEDFLNSPRVLIVAAMRENIPEFNTSMLDMRFLRFFYVDHQTNKTPPGLIEPFMYNCYERLLNFFIEQRMQRNWNEYELAQQNKRYEAWVKENEAGFGNSLLKFIESMPVLITLVAVGYFLFAIKK